MKTDDDRHASKPRSISPINSPALINDVKQTAMGVMALLKNDKKKALHQVKQLSKLNKELACAVLTSDVDGWTPVHACVMRGSKKLLKAMLQVGIAINCTMGQPEGLPGRCTLLHVAANRPDKKMLDYLLHHGADVNARDSDGNTALFYAKLANKDGARLLMSCGATPGDIHDDSHSETHHHQTSDNPPRPLRSSSSLRKEHSHCRSSTDTRQQLQHNKQHHMPKATSQKRSPLAASPVSSSSAAAKPSPTKSHFLTVPPTKLFSSSPCLHQDTSAAGSSSTSIISSSSSDLTCSSHGVPSKGAKAKRSINNNSATITNLNTRELRSGSRSVNTSTESLRKQLEFKVCQNNSD